MDYKADFPPEDFQKDWIRIYLEEFHGRTPLITEIDDLYVNATKFVLMAHMIWAIWALIQAEHSDIDFDYLL